MIYIWIGIIFILSVVELMTSSLIPIWFSLSGIVALIIYMFSNAFFVSVLVFTILGLVLLTLFRNKLLKIKKNIK